MDTYIERIEMSDQEKHEQLLEAIREINKKLDPIYETYMAWQTLGRWGKGILWVAGAVLGLLIAWKQLFEKN